MVSKGLMSLVVILLMTGSFVMLQSELDIS